MVLAGDTGQLQGVADNHQSQRVGRPHVAVWAETAAVMSSG
jgi:hypothetical protein